VRKIVYIVSNVEKSLAFEWVATRLAREYELSFLLLHSSPSSLESFLNKLGITCKRFSFRTKWNIPFVFFKILLYLLQRRPDVVHVHLFEAQRIALPAAWLARVPKRIYTRHTSTFHHEYQPSGIKYDRLSNALATRIVSISAATDYVLTVLEHVAVSKIVHIHHGFDWAAFNEVSADRIDRIRKKWSIPSGRPVVGMVSRFIEWKGVQFAIEGFVSFLEKFPDACLVLANAAGPYELVIAGRLESIRPGTVVLIPFEDDVVALYRVFDLFVHTPVNRHAEAFGQAYVEAMASGVPSVITLSGVAAEFAVDGRNAMVVPYESSEEIGEALTMLWQREELRQVIAKNAREAVVSSFGIDQMIDALKRLYNE